MEDLDESIGTGYYHVYQHFREGGKGCKESFV